MNRHSLFPILLVWFGCSSTIPDWATNQPTDSNYWHGIGRVEKSQYTNPRSSAKEYAIQEVSSQIKVNISSEMKTVIRESNGSLKTATSMVMKSRVDLLLPELEIVGYYKTKDAYFSYVRLNKQKYRAAMAQLRENAKETALGYIRDADKNFSVQSLLLVQKAWQEISPFTDEPIQVFYQGKSVHLYSLIKRKMGEYEDRIQLKGQLDIPVMKLLVDRENSLQISVIDRSTNQPLSGVPISIEFKNDENVFHSDRNGLIRYEIPIQSTKSTFSIYYTLNVIELFRDLSDQSNLLPSNPKKQSIQVKVVPARVKIESNEKNLDRLLKRPMIKPALKKAFSRRVEFVNSGEDMVMKIESDTYVKSERTGKSYPYFTYGSASVIFLDTQTGEEFLATHVSNIKGGDFGSQSTAGIRAYEKMVKQIILELENQLLNL